eukprot:2975942-Amphidinium_carterae.1
MMLLAVSREWETGFKCLDGQGLDGVVEVLLERSSQRNYCSGLPVEVEVGLLMASQVEETCTVAT